MDLVIKWVPYYKELVGEVQYCHTNNYNAILCRVNTGYNILLWKSKQEVFSILQLS